MLFTRYEDYPKFSKLTYCGILSKRCITTKVGKINTERNIKIYQVNIMNTSFERSKQTTDEWYTPKWIVDALGSFDLDPCAPENRLWNTAKRHITPSEDGLKTEWGGVRVWLNPPYSRPLIERFVEKMVRNNNGIALLFNRCDSKMFQDLIFPNASAIMFVKGRIKFYRPDGTQGDSPGCGSVLIAFGEENAKILEYSNIPGKYIKLNN